MRFDNLSDWLTWQESLHPRAIDLGLERVRQVLQRLHPEPPPFAVITIGGTNGKGSCVALTESIYRAAGYSVATYTSPHLIRYTERIRFNGVEVEEEALCAAFDRLDRARGDISLTYFEFGTLAALDLFYRAPPEVVVLEVGMGGRLDAVNVIDPDVAVVTTVDRDHTEWLGSDREAIGREKAGIFRTGRPAICGDRNPPGSLSDHAESIGAQLMCLGREFHGEPTGPDSWCWRGQGARREALPQPALRGAAQLGNAAVVLAVIQQLDRRLPVTQAQVREGLLGVRLPGRFQVIPGDVTVILDVAHNPQAAAELAANLYHLPCTGRTHAVAALLGDKEIAAVVERLKEAIDCWYPAGLAVVRGGDAGLLGDVLEQAGLASKTAGLFDDVAHALAAARSAAEPGDRIVVFGSFYTVGAALGREAAPGA